MIIHASCSTLFSSSLSEAHLPLCKGEEAPGIATVVVQRRFRGGAGVEVLERRISVDTVPVCVRGTVAGEER